MGEHQATTASVTRPTMAPSNVSYIVRATFAWALVLIVFIDTMGLYHGHYDDDHHNYHDRYRYHRSWNRRDHHRRHHHHRDRYKRSLIPGAHAALRRLQVPQTSGGPDQGGGPSPSPAQNGPIQSGPAKTAPVQNGTVATNRYKPARPIKAKWINAQDQLSPEYARLKRVACSITKLSPAQTALMEALIVNASDLPPSLNPVIQCNKERLKRYKERDDIGVRASKDWNVDRIKAQCQHADRWVEFEHCILGRLRTDQDYNTYQDTLRKAVLILGTAI